MDDNRAFVMHMGERSLMIVSNGRHRRSPSTSHIDHNFSYYRFPSETLNLSIIKLDASSFRVEVANEATVAELKQAVEAIFAHVPLKAPGKILWPLVWRQFCLSYQGHKLVTETDYLRDYGIKDGDQLHFVHHISDTCSYQTKQSKKRAFNLKQHKRSSSHELNRHQQKEHNDDDDDIGLSGIVIENGKIQNCNAEEIRGGKSWLSGFLGEDYPHTAVCQFVKSFSTVLALVILLSSAMETIITGRNTGSYHIAVGVSHITVQNMCPGNCSRTHHAKVYQPRHTFSSHGKHDYGFHQTFGSNLHQFSYSHIQTSYYPNFTPQSSNPETETPNFKAPDAIPPGRNSTTGFDSALPRKRNRESCTIRLQPDPAHHNGGGSVPDGCPGQDMVHPLGKFMDERDAAIREKLSSVKDTSSEVKQLEEKANAVMAAARAEIAAALNAMKKETQAEVEEKIAEGRKKVEAELQEALANLERQKEETIKSLDSQIADLSQEIVKKVLPIA
ncbi:hypothetical protein ACSQ67_018729 [Phaseolus vulgaris]